MRCSRWGALGACVRILFGVGVVFGFGSARVESVRGQIASPVRDVRSERSCRVASVGQGWGPWQVAWCRRLSRRGAAFPQEAPTCGGSGSEVRCECEALAHVSYSRRAYAM